MDKESEIVAGVEPVKPTKKKSHKKLILILSIIGGVLVLAGVGFAIWWFAYYNSDKKVLSDAFSNTLSHTEGIGNVKISAEIAESVDIEANIETSYSENGVAANIDAKLSAGFISIGASANLVIDKDSNVYIKINELGKALSSFGIDSDALGGFDIAAISDKWIKISSDDIENFLKQQTSSTGYEEYMKCTTGLVRDLTTNRDFQKDLLTAIQKSEFFSAKRVDKDKNGIKYNLTVDLNQSKALLDNFFKTKYATLILDCNKKLGGDVTLPNNKDDFDGNVDKAVSSLKSNLKDVTITVSFWVGSWGHQPTRLLTDVKVSGEQSVDVNVDFTRKNDKISISIPKDSVDLMSLIQSLSTSSNDTPVTPTPSSDNYLDLFQSL
jgi:hypothetical protein